MFGIGGSEIFVIILIAIMLFGADKVPEIARTLAKGITQLKNATDEIKNEITKSAEENGFDKKSLTSGFDTEFQGLKEHVDGLKEDFTANSSLDVKSITTDIDSEILKAKENLDDLTGPIKRQR
ncbi:twin-arginine translocase TatA/TatE family subunit [Flavobacterium sp.]|jgi:sec-independent protein translocase protein TatA|uniref:twin-arginine translocase TatA/TatE family subunit n=1 Tax=Flavobacterium sp. TaxID=239 RepID=UPI0037C01C00